LTGSASKEARALRWSHVVVWIPGAGEWHLVAETGFRRITRAAGRGEHWLPRELSHSFVSIMSDNGVTIEQVADLVGHRTTIVTQKVYRHQLKPVISTGATARNAQKSVGPKGSGGVSGGSPSSARSSWMVESGTETPKSQLTESQPTEM